MWRSRSADNKKAPGESGCRENLWFLYVFDGVDDVFYMEKLDISNLRWFLCDDFGGLRREKIVFKMQ
jgi:hypothetical protein